MHARFPGKTRLAASLTLVVATLVAASVQARIFFDDFEAGDASAWARAVGYPAMATAYRMSDLDLRDPHVFVDFLGCNDVTDVPLLGFSFNGMLQDLATMDGDGDGFLDLSVLLLFRPPDLGAQSLRLDLAAGICTDPIVGTVCDRDPLAPVTVTAYDSQDAGICLQPEAGTTSGYTPAIGEPAAPCFASQTTTVIVDLAGVEVPLQQARIAGTWVGDPPTAVATGLLSGFLSEAVADALLLPPDLPLIGGQPLSVLLPGGSGNCAPGDDRDMLDEESGWWFYLNFVADEVEYVGS